LAEKVAKSDRSVRFYFQKLYQYCQRNMMTKTSQNDFLIFVFDFSDNRVRREIPALMSRRLVKDLENPSGCADTIKITSPNSNHIGGFGSFRGGRGAGLYTLGAGAGNTNPLTMGESLFNNRSLYYMLGRGTD
jgi:hypothetical protein